MYDGVLDAPFFKMRQQTLHVLSLGISAFGTSWRTQATTLPRIRIILSTFQNSTSQNFDPSIMDLLLKTRAHPQAWETMSHLVILPLHRPLSAVKMTLKSHIAIL